MTHPDPARPAGRPEPSGYQHRASEARLARDRESRQKLMAAIAVHRQRLGQYRALIRRLTVLRNEAAAQAIEDGLRVSTVANVVGESVPRVRAIGLSFDDMAPSPASPGEHLEKLRRTASELGSAAEGKMDVEGQLGALVAHAYRLGFTDDGHLAALTGLSPEAVWQNLRELRRRRWATGNSNPRNH